MQPLEADQAIVPHMKAMNVPFYLQYGSLFCSKGLQSNRPKCLASMADPRASQIMVIKYLSVGQMSRFIYQQIALDVLFQMRYNSLYNSKNQPSDRQKGWGAPFFTSKQDCFAYCFAH